MQDSLNPILRERIKNLTFQTIFENLLTICIVFIKICRIGNKEFNSNPLLSCDEPLHARWEYFCF